MNYLNESTCSHACSVQELMYSVLSVLAFLVTRTLKLTHILTHKSVRVTGLQQGEKVSKTIKLGYLKRAQAAGTNLDGKVKCGIKLVLNGTARETP